MLVWMDSLWWIACNGNNSKMMLVIIKEDSKNRLFISSFLFLWQLCCNQNFHQFLHCFSSLFLSWYFLWFQTCIFTPFITTVLVCNGFGNSFIVTTVSTITCFSSWFCSAFISGWHQILHAISTIFLSTLFLIYMFPHCIHLFLYGFIIYLFLHHIHHGCNSEAFEMFFFLKKVIWHRFLF